MDIKEFYITDLNAGSSEFWSEDKITKLNENFNRLRDGLIQGPGGDVGPIGNVGPTGAAGPTGPVGAAGAVGVEGVGGLNIWERTVNTLKTNVKPRLNTSCVILGFDSNTTVITQPTGTGVATFVDAGKSSLRIHAVDKHGTTTQRNHIELNSNSTDAAAESSYINLDVGSTYTTAKISSKKISISASNITIGDTYPILALTDTAIVINAGTGTLAFGDIGTAGSGDVEITGDVTLNHLSTTYLASTLQTAWDVSSDTTVRVLNKGGNPTWPVAGTITVTGGGVSVSTAYTGATDQNGWIITLTVEADNTSTEVFPAGDTATVSPGGETGFALSATSSYTAGGATDVQFVNVAGSFVGFPYGSIISISTKEYFENFLNDYTSTLVNTGPNESGGQGYESEHGKGFGNYEGWYLCNGMRWQTVHPSPSFSQEIPKLNNTIYDINGVNIPSSSSPSRTYSVTGSTLDIVRAQTTGVITMTATSEEVLLEAGVNTTSQGLGYHDDGWHLNNKIFVVWLGRGDLFWYSHPDAFAEGVG